MTKLEVGQVVRVVESTWGSGHLWEAGRGGIYKNGDLLLVEASTVGHYTTRNLTTFVNDCRVYASEVELVEATPVKILKKIEISGEASRDTPYLEEGMVVDMYRGANYPFCLVGSQSVRLYESEFELVAVDPVGSEITFSDIQVGDRIERTRVFEDGTEMITRGVVDAISGGVARSKAQHSLVTHYSDTTESSTIKLLERNPVNVFEVAGIGSLATVPDVALVFFKKGENLWKPITREGMYGTANRSDEELLGMNATLTHEVP